VTSVLRAVVVTLGVGLGLSAPTARPDELIAVNGERFLGRIVSETAAEVVFESDLAGRLTLPREKVAGLRRTSPEAAAPPLPAGALPLPADGVAITNATTTTNAPLPAAYWWPPTLPADDSFDWIQLKSGEWLKGKLRAVEKRTLKFDSDEFDDVEFDWKDVRRVRSSRPKDLRLVTGETVSGLCWRRRTTSRSPARSPGPFRAINW